MEPGKSVEQETLGGVAVSASAEEMTGDSGGPGRFQRQIFIHILGSSILARSEETKWSARDGRLRTPKTLAVGFSPE